MTCSQCVLLISRTVSFFNIGALMEARVARVNTSNIMALSFTYGLQTISTIDGLVLGDFQITSPTELCSSEIVSVFAAASFDSRASKLAHFHLVQSTLPRLLPLLLFPHTSFKLRDTGDFIIVILLQHFHELAVLVKVLRVRLAQNVLRLKLLIRRQDVVINLSDKRCIEFHFIHAHPLGD